MKKESKYIGHLWVFVQGPKSGHHRDLSKRPGSTITSPTQYSDLAIASLGVAKATLLIMCSCHYSNARVDLKMVSIESSGPL